MEAGPRECQAGTEGSASERPCLFLFAVLFQKLSIADCPLHLRLLAGPDTDVLSFVLKENETGEVEVCLGPLQQPAPGGERWVLLSRVQ